MGLSYSGGGITGILAAMCSHHELLQLAPQLHAMQPPPLVATASGGTLGFLLHQSTEAAVAAGAINPIAYPPPLAPNLTYDVLASNKVPKGSTWWANAINYIPNVTTAAASDAL